MTNAPPALPVWLWMRGRVDARRAAHFAAAAVVARIPLLQAMWREIPFPQRVAAAASS